MEGRSLRRFGALHVLSTPEGLTIQGARARLDAIVDAHARVHTPLVPPVLERGERDGSAYVRFACDAVTDLRALIEAFPRTGQKVPYAAAIAFNELMMDTLEAAHRADDGPLCVGALSFDDVLIGPRGTLWLFGFGHDDADRSREGICQAPEVLLGATPTPASDVYVLHQMLRRLLPYVSLLPSMIAAVAGENAELREAMVRLSDDALASDPARRPPSVAALRERYRAIRAIAGDAMPAPDFEGFGALLRELVRDVVAVPEVLVVDLGRRCLDLPDGRTLDLARRRASWAILAHLVDAHARAPGEAVTLDALLEAAWPGERILPDAARARVYVAVSALRKMGLRAFIVKRDDGYALRVDVQVRTS